MVKNSIKMNISLDEWLVGQAGIERGNGASNRIAELIHKGLMHEREEHVRREVIRQVSTAQKADFTVRDVRLLPETDHLQDALAPGGFAAAAVGGVYAFK